MSEKANVAGLDKDSLKEVLQAVIAEARKPVLTDREKAEIADSQKRREETAASFKQMKDNEQHRQLHVCDHRTRLITGADTGSAIVANKTGKGDVQFFICQHCFLVCAPEQVIEGQMRKGFHDGVLFDNNKFNEFFIQKINTGGI